MKASQLPQMTPLEHLAAVLWTSAAMASLTLLVTHTCSTPYSSSATEPTPSASGAALQTSQTGADSQVDSASCKICESHKKKRGILLKKTKPIKVVCSTSREI